MRTLAFYKSFRTRNAIFFCFVQFFLFYRVRLKPAEGMHRKINRIHSLYPYSIPPNLIAVNLTRWFRRDIHDNAQTRRQAGEKATFSLPIHGTLFAVVEFQGMQYKVTKGDIIMLPRFPAEIGEYICLKKCLAVGGESFTAIGRPFLDDVRITAVVEEHKKSHNVIYFQDKHNRKDVTWRNNTPDVTIIHILKVQYSSPRIVGKISKYTGEVRIEKV